MAEVADRAVPPVVAQLLSLRPLVLGTLLEVTLFFLHLLPSQHLVMVLLVQALHLQWRSKCLSPHQYCLLDADMVGGLAGHLLAGHLE